MKRSEVIRKIAEFHDNNYDHDVLCGTEFIEKLLNYIEQLGFAKIVHLEDLPGDPIFYHPELNQIRVWTEFGVLMPEVHGWIVIGKL
jgi:hypothetical protein